ncbi:aldehyde dehydrogenase family protein [Salinarimonas rosea]|uniref:aldehyde dehydrogenase family protein n=1 Tax=Salinarimonas rosea TaxID=552063 RepID=UPI000490F4A1|nr:aldehyde dehydrogenase family protein [Salinarimonas rosea]
MRDFPNFYVNGAWTPAHGRTMLEVVDPASEESFARIAMGDSIDVDAAVAAAKHAFAGQMRSSRREREDLLESVVATYERRYDDIVEAITREMGAPLSFSREAQAAAGLGHLGQALEALRAYRFDEAIGDTLVAREPIGVCALITPWNWPMNQIACKVGPALAAGCTMVLKPSEIAPISAIVFSEVLHEAGVPAGVYNMIHGDGETVGQALAGHRDVDMVSFTGSTRGGIAVALTAAPTVKRVAQELGGKSANILLPDADLARAVSHGARQCFSNSGQSCNAPTRMLVPRDRQEEAIAIARRVAEETRVGDPRSPATTIGPVVSRRQFDRIQSLIEIGIAEGARLVAGGPGQPDGLNRGYYVRPTIFADVHNDMTIAREEIFGPVLAMIPYGDEEEAIAIANDTIYGLASYVSSGDLDRARRVARRLRSGMVHLDGAPAELPAPFGGYKQSGNGREWGRFGLEDYLETKSIFGFRPAG